MILSSLIRKRDTGNLATAIPAIFATQLKEETGKVARIANVAVAKPQTQTATMTAELVRLVALVGRAYELSDSEISEAIHIAMDDYSDALTCYTSLAKTLGISLDDDRRMCFECAELSGSYCVAARRGELQGAGKYYRPVKYLPRRCEGYKPK